MPNLSFKAKTHAYLLETSIAHNKNNLHLLNLLINWISGKSAPKMLSLNDENTYVFQIFY